MPDTHIPDQLPALPDIISSELSSVARQQMIRAIKKTRSDPGNFVRNFVRNFIQPYLVQEETDIYFPLLPTKNYRGWRPDHSVAMSIDGLGPCEIASQTELFTNFLYVPERDETYGTYGDGQPKFEPPSARIANGGFFVFTIEIDDPKIKFLEEQLSWCRATTGKSKDSVIGKLNGHLNSFIDYRGVTAVYSGNKSIHFHFVFDSTHLDLSRCSKDAKAKQIWICDVPDKALGLVYRNSWYRLAEAFKQYVPGDYVIDQSLSNICQLKRMPGGIREAGNDHLLGIEPGTKICQCVLLDMIKSRSPRNANRSFIEVSPDFINHVPVINKTHLRSTDIVPHEEVNELIIKLADYCKSEWGNEYPRPVALSDEGGINTVFWQNSKTDQNPTTICQGPYRKLLVNGQNDFDGPVFLPNELTMDETLSLLRGIEPSETRSKLTEAVNNRPYFEKTFAKSAFNKKTARRKISGLTRMLSKSSYICIKSAEGIGKTYALMKDYPQDRLDEHINNYVKLDKIGFLSFAFKSYEQAKEKCREFNCLHQNTEFEGILLQSFPHLYRQQCIEYGVKPISLSELIKNQQTHLIFAVQSLQPELYNELIKKRNEIWKGDFSPVSKVIFTVHAVAHHWGQSGISRAWYHPEFDRKVTADNLEYVSELRKDLWITDLIHDEVSFDDLIHVEPKQKVDWAHLVKENTGSWEDASLLDRYAAYSSVKNANSDFELSFEECCSLIDAHFKDEDLKICDPDLLPFGNDNTEKGIYRRQVGTQFYYKPKSWFSLIGGKIKILTTEEMPCRVLDAITWNSDDEIKGFRVYRLGFEPNSIS